MSSDRADGTQLMEIHRRLTATIPIDLTGDEAEAIINTGGIFPLVENVWLTSRSTFANTLMYRKYIGWATLPMTFVVSPILSGFTLSILWSWFVVDWYGLKSLPIPIAIGLMLMAGLLTANLQKMQWKDKSYKVRFWRILITPFLKTALFLGFGWFIHLFVHLSV